ncbi:MAG: type II secretion system protein [Candidatus Riflebacteria bacterium]|nr:type II secretion system protein [Candidatus Riflebacteria bacterium]
MQKKSARVAVSFLRFRRNIDRCATTLIEVLVVLSILGLAFGAIYKFFQHYTSSYVKIDDKLESVAEGWQVMRMLKDDLLTADCPSNGDITRWKETLKNSSPDSNTGIFEISRRYDDQLGTTSYHLNRKKGDITREERFPGKSLRSSQLLQNRCSTFSIDLMTEPAVVPPGSSPRTIYFRVHLELGNVSNPKATSVPLILDTNIIPIFLNQRLSHHYVHEGMPN